jgi:hypothetical protein
MTPAGAEHRVIGRYALYAAVASGGMANVHFGRLLGPVGFARTVAIKRMHDHIARDPQFVSMFLDEARLASRIRHPNVVPTLDVVAAEGELLLVMEYVHGETLARLIRGAIRAERAVPPRVAVALIAGVLLGLHAAHEATDERGEPMGVVHRDVSPQNIIVGVDGVARVLDFGIAKAVGRSQTTGDGALKGKLGYMSPEQIKGLPPDRRSDVFTASVVLWETLTSRRLFHADNEGAIVERLLSAPVVRPIEIVPDIPKELDAVVMRGLERDRSARFATAREMALALEDALPPATAAQVGQWVEQGASEELEKRAKIVAQIEAGSRPGPARPSNVVHHPARPRVLAVAIALAAVLGLGAGVFLVPRSASRTAAGGATAGGLGPAGTAQGRCNPRAPFGPPTPVRVQGVANSSSARLTPDELTLYFQQIAQVCGDGGNCQSGYALYYASRTRLDAPFSNANGLTQFRVNTINESPSVDATNTILYFDATSAFADAHRVRTLYYATRSDIRSPFGAPTAYPGFNVNLAEAYVLPDSSYLYYLRIADTDCAIERAALSNGMLLEGQPVPGLVGCFAAPTPTPDQLTIYVQKRDANGRGHIAKATRPDADAPFSEPELVPELDVMVTHDTPTWISSDGCHLYFDREDPDAGMLGIYLAARPPQ